jgi:hypothetical protein
MGDARRLEFRRVAAENREDSVLVHLEKILAQLRYWRGAREGAVVVPPTRDQVRVTDGARAWYLDPVLSKCLELAHDF